MHYISQGRLVSWIFIQCIDLYFWDLSSNTYDLLNECLISNEAIKSFSKME